MYRAIGCFLVLSAVALAADFWSAKPYTEWSDKEAAKLLSNSPWAHEVALSASTRAADGGPLIGSGGPPRPQAGGSGVNSAPMDAVGTLPDGTRRPGDPPSANSGPGAETPHAIVRWQSALPVKQALLVRKGRTDLTSPEDAKRFLEADEPQYVLAVSGLRMTLPLGGAVPAMKEAIRASAWLLRKGKDPIAAEKVEMFARTNGVELFVLFPKTKPIAVEDREVEFRAATASGEVQAKFRVKEMLLGGKPAL